MKVYEYANKRNIKSRVLVKQLQEMGVHTVKNHLSLVPEKMLDELDALEFKAIKQVSKDRRSIMILTLSGPEQGDQVGERIEKDIEQFILEGHGITIILPLALASVQFKKATQTKNMNFTFDGNRLTVDVYVAKEGSVTYYYLVNDALFKREKHYGYRDDPLRFACIAKVTRHLLQELTIDQIEMHDWPFGLLPIMLKHQLKVEHLKVRYHLYRVSYQGIYDKSVLKYFDLIDYYEHTEHANSVNFTKAALLNSDRVIFENESFEDFKSSYLRESVYDNL